MNDILSENDFKPIWALPLKKVPNDMHLIEKESLDDFSIIILERDSVK